MFVIWVGCVLEIILVNCLQLKGKEQKHLQIALQKINSILDDVDEKITKERALLVRAHQKDGKETSLESLLNAPLDGSKEASSLLDLLSDNITTTATTLLLEENIPILQRTATESAITESDTITANDTEPLTISSTENVTVIISKKTRMIDDMTKYNVGYLFTSVKGALESVLYMPDDDLASILNALGIVTVRMANQRKFHSFGELLATRLNNIWIWLRILTPAIVKSYSSTGLSMFEDDRIDDDIKDIISSYDKFFNEEEGNLLLDSVVKIDDYSIYADNANATAVCEDLVTAIMAPANRKEHSYELRLWVNKVNKAYMNRFWITRRGGDEIQFNYLLLTSTEYKNSSQTPSRRRLGKSSKYIKLEYLKLMRHLILKHSKLFKQFAKHYKLTERRKHRYDKNYRTVHRSRLNRYEHRYNKRNKKKTAKIYNQNLRRDTDITRVTIDPTYRTTPLKAHFKSKNRFKIISVMTGHPKPTIQSLLTQKLISASKPSNMYMPEILNSLNNAKDFNLPENIGLTKPIIQRNKILQKLLKDPRYNGNQESYKTMLNNVPPRGNNNLNYSQYNIKFKNHSLRASKIDSDEEWIFKTNIYKSFQQKQV